MHLVMKRVLIKSSAHRCFLHLNDLSYNCYGVRLANALNHHRGISSTSADEENNNNANKSTKIYLHVGPSGDCWTGSSIFAAKHLQPDYVKSIELPAGICNDAMLSALENDVALAQQAYDEGKLPKRLLEIVSKDQSDNSNER